MTTHSERQQSPYDTLQLFNLVADVARYPEFLPWCKAARILSFEGNVMRAELVIRFGHMSESYESEVTLNPPPRAGEPGKIDVVMVRGPFAHLINRWQFLPRDGGGSEIDFFIDFQFRSRLLETMMGGLFSKALLKMVDAFRERAAELYGRR